MVFTQAGKLGAERLAIKIRWLLAVAVAVLGSERISDPTVLGSFGTFVVMNLMAAFLLKDEEFYERRAQQPLRVFRFVDALLVAGAAWIPGAMGSNAYLLSIPVIIAHAMVERDLRRTLSAALPLGLIQGAGLFLGGATLFTQASAFGTLTFSTMIGIVLSNLQSREEVLSKRDRKLTAVLNCGSALGDNRELQPTLFQALKTAVIETKGQCGYIMLTDPDSPDTLLPEVAFSAVGEFDFPESMSVGFGLSGYVAKNGQPITVSLSSDQGHEFDGVTAGVRAAASVPLLAQGYGSGVAQTEQVLGVLTVLDVQETGVFSNEDMDLLRSLSSLTAVAVSNARMEERRRMTFLRTLQSLATALEARDEYTRGHSQRVCEVSMLIGERMGLGADALEELRIGTILHDIGKIGVPDAILNKRARLTDEEFQTMKSHPVIGYEICKPLMLSEGVLLIIRNHHEKLDGSGYPDGLKGGELPLSLRIVCVADAFDAMSSKRPYRGVMELSQVMAEMSRGAGTQFDPVVVECLKQLLSAGEINELYAAYWDVDQDKEEAA
jgi:putative nucleotidyltransferase with HDIG domain